MAGEGDLPRIAVVPVSARSPHLVVLKAIWSRTSEAGKDQRLRSALTRRMGQSNPNPLPSPSVPLPSDFHRTMGVHGMMAMAAAAAQFPPAAARRTWLPASRLPLTVLRTSRIPSRLLVVASSQSNFSRVVQTAWRVGKDAVEAGSSLVLSSVPRPFARIGVTFIAVSVALFLLKSVISTALFALAVMGLVYFGFLAMNPKEGSRVDEKDNPSEDPAEQARRIMEKYK